MSAIREEEIKAVVGGTVENLGGRKFADGENVISRTNPSMGIGTVAGAQYHEGWRYFVKMNGGILFIPENDLVPALQ